MKYTLISIAASTLLATPFYASMAQATAAPTPPHPGFFSEVDTDHDGAISKDEWRAHGDKLFDKNDTNHDGKISQEEMKAHFSAKREEFKSRREAWKAKQASKPAAPDTATPAAAATPAAPAK